MSDLPSGPVVPTEPLGLTTAERVCAEPAGTMHTPGPWHTDPDYPIEILSADRRHLGTARPVSFPETDCIAEAKANAVLMAAAPDLLALCREALNYAPCIPIPAEREAFRARLRAAIERAAKGSLSMSEKSEAPREPSPAKLVMFGGAEVAVEPPFFMAGERK